MEKKNAINYLIDNSDDSYARWASSVSPKATLAGLKDMPKTNKLVGHAKEEEMDDDPILSLMVEARYALHQALVKQEMTHSALIKIRNRAVAYKKEKARVWAFVEQNNLLKFTTIGEVVSNRKGR
jgi:hypothetical protein